MRAYFIEAGSLCKTLLPIFYNSELALQMSKYLAFMATKEGWMLKMLNLKDRKVNKKYPSICPLKQNKESLAVFKLDSVVFILSAICCFCSFSSGLPVQPHTLIVGLPENHGISLQLHAPLLFLGVDHHKACTGPCTASLSSGKRHCHPIPSLSSHFLQQRLT